MADGARGAGLTETGWYGGFRNGGTKSSILIGFSTINRPFWGSPIYGNLHIGWCVRMCIYVPVAPPNEWNVYTVYIFSYDDGMPPGINELKNGQFQWKGIQTCFQCCHNVFRQYVIKCQDGATSLAPKWGSLTLGFNWFIIKVNSIRGIVIGCHWSPDLRYSYSQPTFIPIYYIPIYSYIVHGLRHGLHLVALDQVLSSARDENGDGQDRFDIASFNACLGAMAWPQAMAWLQKVGNWGIGTNDLVCCISII